MTFDITLNDFKCLDFNFIKNELKLNLILDLIDIVTYYLEPKYTDLDINYQQKTLEYLRNDCRFFDKNNYIENLHNIKNIFCADVQNNIKNFIFGNIINIIYSVIFTKFPNRKRYLIAEFKQKSENSILKGKSEYIFFIRSSDQSNISFYIESDIYKIIKLIDNKNVIENIYASFFL
jgi:hypothetical protein